MKARMDHIHLLSHTIRILSGINNHEEELKENQIFFKVICSSVNHANYDDTGAPKWGRKTADHILHLYLYLYKASADQKKKTLLCLAMMTQVRY